MRWSFDYCTSHSLLYNHKPSDAKIAGDLLQFVAIEGLHVIKSTSTVFSLLWPVSLPYCWVGQYILPGPFQLRASQRPWTRCSWRQDALSHASRILKYKLVIIKLLSIGSPLHPSYVYLPWFGITIQVTRHSDCLQNDKVKPNPIMIYSDTFSWHALALSFDRFIALLWFRFHDTKSEKRSTILFDILHDNPFFRRENKWFVNNSFKRIILER